jgi:hypothetical protein
MRTGVARDAATAGFFECLVFLGMHACTPGALSESLRRSPDGDSGSGSSDEIATFHGYAPCEFKIGFRNSYCSRVRGMLVIGLALPRRSSPSMEVMNGLVLSTQ